MLELLDTGRIAHKFGKWRWTLYFAAGLCVFLLGWAITELLTIPSLMSPLAADTTLPLWSLVGFSVVSLLLFIYSAWLCYIDQMHQAYVEVAQHFKAHGW